MNNIRYVVGHKWDADQPITLDGDNLAIYTYFREIQHGTMKEARKFKKYCESRDKSNKYAIYRVIIVPVK